MVELGSMKKIILKNGLTILIDERKTDTITVMATVKTGSNNETKGIHGISHFIEHMPFEGTKKRPTNREILFSVKPS